MTHSLILHPKTAKQFAAISKKPAHCYIFSGPRHTGKMTAACELARELSKISHLPNQYAVIVEAVDQKRLIKIDQIRELNDFLNLKNFNPEAYKVVIIKEADRLSLEAASSLLKNLEEPHPQTVFVLTTNNLESILPTVRSRGQLIHFLPVSEAKIKNFLSERFPHNRTVDDVINLADGQVGLSIKLIQDAHFYQFKQELSALANNYLQLALTGKFKIVQDVAARQQAQAFLTEVIRLLRRQALQQPANFASLGAALEAEQYLTVNINPRLTLEFLSLRLT